MPLASPLRAVQIPIFPRHWSGTLLLPLRRTLGRHRWPRRRVHMELRLAMAVWAVSRLAWAALRLVSRVLFSTSRCVSCTSKLLFRSGVVAHNWARRL